MREACQEKEITQRENGHGAKFRVEDHGQKERQHGSSFYLYRVIMEKQALEEIAQCGLMVENKIETRRIGTSDCNVLRR